MNKKDQKKITVIVVLITLAGVLIGIVAPLIGIMN